MNDYELLYVVSPRVAADDVPNAVERVSTLIRNGGGEVLSVDTWGRRRLAYPIGRFFEGTYVLTTLRMPSTGAAQIEAGLGISEDVIRHLLIGEIIPPTSRGRSQREDERERPPRDDDRERPPRDADRERAPRDAERAEPAPSAAPPEEPAQEGRAAEEREETPEPAGAPAE